VSASPGADGAPEARDIDRLDIELRVTADDLDPERVTRMLGVNPTLAARKGDEVDKGGVPVAQRTGTWSYALPASPEWELGDAIDTLLEQLPHDPALWESLAGWATASVVCGLYIHGVDRAADLAPDTLARLAERRLALRLEIRGASPT
jgi:uncharacterized protein DUF4279